MHKPGILGRNRCYATQKLAIGSVMVMIAKYGATRKIEKSSRDVMTVRTVTTPYESG